MTATADVIARLRAARIVPVVEITSAAQGVRLAEVLTEAGLPVAEVTLRTPAALDAIRAIAEALPDFLIGAGTLMTGEHVSAAAAAGARFGVSPGFTPGLSAAATAAGLPFVPGVSSASEALAAFECGHRELKFFPAEQSGGASAIAALGGPFAPLEISFMPTGGIRPETVGSYLDLHNVFAVGGTWIARKDAIAEERFDEIALAARDAVRSASRS